MWPRIGPRFNHGVVSTNLFCMRVMANMSDQPPALPNPSSSVAADADYDSIHAAVMETVRGRWFLSEYARRNRTADTDTLLTAIGRIESLIQERGEDAAVLAVEAAQPADAILQEAMPQEAIGQARDRLALLHDQLRDIAESLIECGAPSFLTNDLKRRVAELSQIAGRLGEPVGDIAADEAELFDAVPEPQASSLMASSPQPDVAEASAPEVIDNREREVIEAREPAALKIPEPEIVTPEPAVIKSRLEPKRDPFADIRALSDAEKIALFT